MRAPEDLHCMPGTRFRWSRSSRAVRRSAGLLAAIIFSWPIAVSLPSSVRARTIAGSSVTPLPCRASFDNGASLIGSLRVALYINARRLGDDSSGHLLGAHVNFAGGGHSQPRRRHGRRRSRLTIVGGGGPSVSSSFGVRRRRGSRQCPRRSIKACSNVAGRPSSLTIGGGDAGAGARAGQARFNLVSGGHISNGDPSSSP